MARDMDRDRLTVLVLPAALAGLVVVSLTSSSGVLDNVGPVLKTAVRIAM